MAGVQQYCTFSLGELYLGIDVRKVREVLRHQQTTRVPLAPEVVSGLINVRGQIVMAIDLRRRFQLPDRPPGLPPTNVIIYHRDGPVSLLVDELCAVLELDESNRQPPPATLDALASEFVDGVHLLKGRLLLILAPERIVDLHAPAQLTAAKGAGPSNRP